MTEGLPPSSNEQQRDAEDLSQSLGATALEGSELQEAQALTTDDLVRHEATHIYPEFLSYARDHKFKAEQAMQKTRQQNRSIDYELERQLMMPKIVYRFVRQKSKNFIEAHHDHPVLMDVREPLPEKMVMANLRQLHHDKAKSLKQNHGAFLAKQEAFQKIATDLENQFPEVLFATALRNTFEDYNDPKYASYASDVINAIGRTLRILGKLHLTPPTPEPESDK